MAVEDVQQFIDLLELSPEVTELSVRSAAGTKIRIKRQPVSLSSPPAVIDVMSQAEPVELVSVSEQSPKAQVSSITATLVGLFHATNPPVLSGAGVVPGQIVGYIESMRLMNEVVSTFDGIIDVAAAAEGQPVEYGQLLFSISSR